MDIFCIHVLSRWLKLRLCVCFGALEDRPETQTFVPALFFKSCLKYPHTAVLYINSLFSTPLMTIFVNSFPMASRCLYVKTNEELIVRSCSMSAFDNTCGLFEFENVRYSGCLMSCTRNACNKGHSLQTSSRSFLKHTGISLMMAIMSVTVPILIWRKKLWVQELSEVIDYCFAFRPKFGVSCSSKWNKLFF